MSTGQLLQVGGGVVAVMQVGQQANKCILTYAWLHYIKGVFNILSHQGIIIAKHICRNNKIGWEKKHIQSHLGTTLHAAQDNPERLQEREWASKQGKK